MLTKRAERCPGTKTVKRVYNRQDNGFMEAEGQENPQRMTMLCRGHGHFPIEAKGELRLPQETPTLAHIFEDTSMSLTLLLSQGFYSIDYFSFPSSIHYYIFPLLFFFLKLAKFG